MAARREQRGQRLTDRPVADDRDVGVEGIALHVRLLSGGERPVAGVLLDDVVLDRADAVDLDADAVAGLQPRPALAHRGGDPRRRAGGDHVARLERARLGEDLDLPEAVEDQLAGCWTAGAARR